MTIPLIMYLQTVQELHEMKEKSEGEEGTPVAAPATKKCCATYPYHPGCCGTLLFSSMHHNYLKDLPQGTILSPKRGFHRPARKRGQGKSSRIHLVDVNGGLQYRVHIFTFWHKQVNKGSMPELDMEHNYIGLYKTHEDTFKIMLAPKPKRLTPKKKKTN